MKIHESVVSMAGIYSSAHIAPEGLVDGSDEVFLSGRRDYAPTDYPNNHGFAAMEPYSTGTFHIRYVGKSAFRAGKVAMRCGAY